jgi:hypothetical protein
MHIFKQGTNEDSPCEAHGIVLVLRGEDHSTLTVKFMKPGLHRLARSRCGADTSGPGDSHVNELDIEKPIHDKIFI